MKSKNPFVILIVFFAALNCPWVSHGQELFASDSSNPVFLLKDTKIAYQLFWSTLKPGLRDDLIEWYTEHLKSVKTNFAKAEVTALLGRMKDDKRLLCESIGYYEKATNEVENPEMIYEILFMVNYECGGDYRKRLDEIIKHTKGWKQKFYRKLKEDHLRFPIQKLSISKKVEVPQNVSRVVLGKSFIEVPEHSKIGFQVERVYRDWLSNSLDVFPYDDVPREEIITYHEGSRLRDLLSCGLDFELLPLTPAIVVQATDGRWYAPDENGIFRFEVLQDKVMYPTTKCYKNVCLLTDTHGISALVPGAIEKGVDLVIGCGDYTGKMEAAYYLASKGIDVYFPGDRFVAEVLGHDANGVLMGTAPVKGNIIGNQPISIEVKELIIVQDISKPYPAQYYDAPTRYFTELNKLVNLNLEFVKVDDLGETSKIVDRARERNAKVIAVRVFDDKDYESVREWLQEDKDNRAVLFHTSLYPTQKIFYEFPLQTSFGDPRPIFE